MYWLFLMFCMKMDINYFLCFVLRVVPVVLEDYQSFSKRYKNTQVKLQFLIYELWSVRTTSSRSDYVWTNLRVIQECITSKAIIFVTVRLQRKHSSRLAGSCFLSAKVIRCSVCCKKKGVKNFYFVHGIKFTSINLH